MHTYRCARCGEVLAGFAGFTPATLPVSGSEVHNRLEARKREHDLSCLAGSDGPGSSAEQNPDQENQARQQGFLD